MIFCVEDDANIRELEVYTLRSVGYEALGMATAGELFGELAKSTPQLIILDIMLPDEDGMSILNRLRGDSRWSEVPVIMATAKTSEYDKVRGLDQGADDYIAKPFGMMEMVSRVKAVLRRVVPAEAQAADKSILTGGPLRLDTVQYRVWVQDQEVSLTLKEFEVLKKMLLHPGRVYSREQLLTDIWGYEFTGETRTVDVHIRTLRQKLGPQAESLVETVRGVGYRFQEKPENS